VGQDGIDDDGRKSADGNIRQPGTDLTFIVER